MKTSLHIAYILKRYPRLSETFIVNEIRELKKQGVKITIFAKKNPQEKIVHRKVKKLKAPVYYLEESKKRPVKISTAALLIKKLGINHIHAHFASWAAAFAYDLNKITGIPYSFTAHAKDIYHKSVNKKTLRKKIARAMFVITVTDYNRVYLQSQVVSSASRGQIIRLYNGLDLQDFKQPRIKKSKKIILSVGRLIEKKGFQYLIEACQMLKKMGISLTCFLVGEGEERRNLETKIKKLSLEKEILMIGAKAQEELIQIMRKASVFVLPCIIDQDGNQDALPTVILEAMAQGIPVVSTNINGIPEIITNGENGILVSPKNSVQLAYAIKKVLSDTALARHFSKAGRKKVREIFDIRKNVKKLKEYFILSTNLSSAKIPKQNLLNI